MINAAGNPPKTTRRRFGSLGGWLVIAICTAAGLFMFSGAIGHSAQPPAHPIVGNLGWMLAGLSPAIAYVSYQLLRRLLKSTIGHIICIILALAIAFACQCLGVAMLRYALPGQILRMG